MTAGHFPYLMNFCFYAYYLYHCFGITFQLSLIKARRWGIHRFLLRVNLKSKWTAKRSFQLCEINHVDIIWEWTELSKLFIRNVNIFIPTLISDEILTDSAKLITTGNGFFCKFTESIQVLNEGSDENIYQCDINPMSRVTRVKLLPHPLN